MINKGLNKCVALTLCSIATLGASLVPVSALSHHSFLGQFDSQRSIEIEGVVTMVSWRNPHATLEVETIDENGNTAIWELETGSPTIMSRAGVPSGSINKGDNIRVAGYPSLTNSEHMFATNVLSAQGVELIMQTGATPKWSDEISKSTGDYSYRFRAEGDASRPELGMFRIWSFTGTATFLFPESINPNYDLNTYPMNEAAKAALTRFNPATDNPTLNCIPKGMPTIMEQPYPMLIEQVDDDIAFHIEEYDLVRTIHMNQSNVPANIPATDLGYSLGHWDGETLVVTTSHLSWPYFNQSGIPQSAESELVERFTLSADTSQLDYELTITDPVYFTEPVNLNRNWIYVPTEELLPYECTTQ